VSTPAPPPSVSDSPAVAQSPRPQNQAVRTLVQVHGKSCVTPWLHPIAAGPPAIRPTADCGVLLGTWTLWPSWQWGRRRHR
jgi:hypothetical protein